MPFVKLDCGILRSTLWFEKDQRDVFLASLLLAEPREFTEPVPEIKIRSLELTGWAAPPGWYGFVPAASVGICDCAKIEFAKGLNALERLASPEAVSRSADFEGRRMIRIDGGFLILNFQKYRDRDYTTAERSARYRTRKQQLEEQSSRRDTVTPRRDITQAEAEVRSQKSEIRNNPRAPNESAQVGSQAELIPRTAEPAKQPKERPRDPLFDALASACGSDPRQMTSREARACAVALAEIKKACPGLTVAEIQRRAKIYREAHKTWALTVSAFCAYWGECGQPARPRIPESDYTKF